MAYRHQKRLKVFRRFRHVPWLDLSLVVEDQYMSLRPHLTRLLFLAHLECRY